MRQMVLELNASDDRGIDVVREQIKTFASTPSPLFPKPLPRPVHASALVQDPDDIPGTKRIFTSAPSAAPNPNDTDANQHRPPQSLATFKLIILDEADAMTSTAQMALRRIMEKYTANTRFCIIANYTHKLSPALLSRCTRFRFSPLKERDIRSIVELVIDKEGVKIVEEAVEALVRLSKGDMRRALNVLQACFASSMFPFAFCHPFS